MELKNTRFFPCLVYSQNDEMDEKAKPKMNMHDYSECSVIL